MSFKRFIMPTLIIFIGCAWLLNSLEILPGIRWVWFLLFSSLGIFVGLGFDKVTFVIGTFFSICAICAFLRQVNWLKWGIELPILVISFGILYLIAILLPLPFPEWWNNDHKKN